MFGMFACPDGKLGRERLGLDALPNDGRDCGICGIAAGRDWGIGLA